MSRGMSQGERGERACVELLKGLGRGYQLIGNSLLAMFMQFVLLGWLKLSTKERLFISVYSFASVSINCSIKQ